jgi:cytochrome c oxidase cbb3-type subunit 2
VRPIVFGCFIAVLATALVVSRAAAQSRPDGKHVYEHHCAVCHGAAGDGKGPAAERLVTRPADFTQGRYKFRSTPSGAAPTDEDLLRTITRGVRGTAMLGHPGLPVAAQRALVTYLRTFSSREARPPVPVPAAPAATADVVSRGAKLYKESGCPECHGAEGRGDGPSARKGMKDARELPITPTDLTWRPFKRGSEPSETWKSIANGLDGTPMPSYSDALTPQQIWDVVLFLESLVTPERRRPEDRLLPGDEALGDQINREQHHRH